MARKKETESVKSDIKYLSLTNMLKIPAQYYLIWGERSNGKSFAVKEIGFDDYVKNGNKMAIIRRQDIDIEAKTSSKVWSDFVDNPTRGNLVAEKTGGLWNDIWFWRGAWYLSKWSDDGRRIREPEPFCYAFAISIQEHYKSTSYPNVKTVLFDEFLTRTFYLNDEFVSYTNLLSTIIRDRDDVRIFMCGNTVNKYNPYFKEMGLTNAEKIQKGEMQLYEFATMHKNKHLRIVCYYSDLPSKTGKPSDIYFAFDNPKLQMITQGVWELALYPHLPYKYKPMDIMFTYFIKWEQQILQCEIISIDVEGESVNFTYIHNKTTPIQNENHDLIFSTEYNPLFNWRRKLTQPQDLVGKKIKFFFDHDKVFYQDNEVGEVVRNYLNWCKTDRGIQ